MFMQTQEMWDNKGRAPSVYVCLILIYYLQLVPKTKLFPKFFIDVVPLGSDCKMIDIYFLFLRNVLFILGFNLIWKHKICV